MRDRPKEAKTVHRTGTRSGRVEDDPGRRVRRAAELRRLYERAGKNAPFKAIVALLLVGFICMDVTLILARVVGVQGVLYYPDTPYILMAFGSFLLTVAVIWDGLLCGFGVMRAIVDRRRGHSAPSRSWWGVWRSRGFFSIGIWPLPFVLVTIYFLVGTSNISNISLQLLESTTTWKDSFFWGLEEPLLVAATQGGVNVVFWESIYNSGWQAEMLVLFGVIVVARCPVRVVAFCISFTLLFYIGRLLGLVSPVMGPAFYVPEHFSHLDGSITEWMMRRVEVTMSAGPDAIGKGAVLLGGIAAMPSLHVGMISLASWWLAISAPRTTPLVIAWLCTVWASTVLLGWHYILDGLGGIATAALCIALTGAILRWMKLDADATDSAAEEPTTSDQRRLA